MTLIIENPKAEDERTTRTPGSPCKLTVRGYVTWSSTSCGERPVQSVTPGPRRMPCWRGVRSARQASPRRGRHGRPMIRRRTDADDQSIRMRAKELRERRGEKELLRRRLSGSESAFGETVLELGIEVC